MMTTNNIIFKTTNLRKTYKVRIDKLFEKPKVLKAVNGIDLEIFKGEVFAIVGESGCGKSTLGNMIANLTQLTSGDIQYEGESLQSFNNKKNINYRKNVQIIFQDPYSSLNPKKRIGWLLEEPLVIYKIDKKLRKDIVIKALCDVGLDESYLLKYPHELSGGQRQRVNIAIALIMNPKFIIADEAVSALDVSIQAQILNLLKKLQKEYELTYLFISHNLNVVHYISDRIGVMYLGKIVELGGADKVFYNPKHPYTQALISSAPNLNSDQNRKKIILEGEVPNPINPPIGCAFSSRCWQSTERCKTEEPELIKNTDGHYVRCFFA